MNVHLNDLIFNLNSLKAGRKILFSGTIYTARDAAHKRIINLLDSGNKDKIPFNLTNSAIYYCGPTPTKPGNIVGACGPTTSSRMDVFTPRLLKEGIKVLIGKGDRSKEVENSIKKNNAIYFIVTGGVAALISKSVIKADLIAFEDLGPEAIYRFEVKDMPLIVAIDNLGNNIFVRG
ncbi:MAG: FumA C-terminus/TtdB family hydratase beta subunit [Endomicrobium sp.]|jgi:fumarate hydratase subunit beta|uniref:FumA C-terminus/TtdB family hydratase beta subunit n=1 Tax=Candidatus Endomicrobiellum cubanum TaxID=3242325 RepID=UPI002839295F|nr:FumA C-terminus/TtdB family hydratase beta subunit [Endomicrobium sp.]MDR2396063.1 FumA C-terminus/TtdB family hydratase beta subunit [Endomicrobium sp.]